jgi:hypothetical protein
MVGGQQRHLADLAQVEPQRVERGLDGEVELRALLLFGEGGLLVRRMLVVLSLHQLDGVVDQVRVEVFDLLLGELDFLEPGDDLVVGKEPFLESVLNELVELFYVRKRDVDGEHLTSGLSRGWLSTYLETKEPDIPSPGSPSWSTGCYTRNRKFDTISLQA